mgnify:CR=1 FL=1
MTDERPMGVLDTPNDGREMMAALHGVVYARHPVRTHLVTAVDDAADVVGRDENVAEPDPLGPARGSCARSDRHSLGQISLFRLALQASTSGTQPGTSGAVR